MNEDDDMSAMAHQQELEGREFEERWEAIRAACHREWKAQLEAMTSQRKETNNELECF
jgi:hypothetical protein